MADEKEHARKNPCPDCAFCQYCSETRCGMCRPPSKKKPKEENKLKIHKPLFRTY